MSRKIDQYLKIMTVGQLRQEVMRLRGAFRAELKNTGNRRCWINLLQHLPEGGTISPLSLPRDVFLGNCSVYYNRNKK